MTEIIMCCRHRLLLRYWGVPAIAAPPAYAEARNYEQYCRYKDICQAERGYLPCKIVTQLHEYTYKAYEYKHWSCHRSNTKHNEPMVLSAETYGVD